MSLLVIRNPSLITGTGPAPGIGGGGGGALVSRSDWSNGTGTGDTAIGDGGYWNIRNASSRMSVVTALSTGLSGWPTTNVLRMEYTGSPSYGLDKATAVSGWTTPGNGQTLYKRLYHATTVVGETSGVSDHPVQNFDTVPQACSYEWFFASKGAGSYLFRHACLYDCSAAAQTGGPSALAHRWQVTLAPSTVYRHEWAVTGTADPLEFYIESRVYNSAGTLLFEPATMPCSISGHLSHAQDDQSPNLFVPSGTEDAFGGITILDQGGHDRPGEYHYYAGFAVATSTWCGPWSAP